MGGPSIGGGWQINSRSEVKSAPLPRVFQGCVIPSNPLPKADTLFMRFGSGNPLPETLPAFFSQVEDAFQRYYMRSWPRKIWYALTFSSPRAEDEALNLEQRLWQDVFIPLTEQPVVARQKIRAWQKAEPLATQQPLLSFLMTHLSNQLDKPAQLYREVSLASLALMSGGLPQSTALATVVQSMPFKTASLEKQAQMLTPLLQPFVDPLLKKPVPLAKTLGAYAETLKAYPDPWVREIGPVILQHFKNVLGQSPEAVKQELSWWQSRLDEGGWLKLSQLEVLAENPDGYTAAEQSRLLFDGWEPIVKSIRSNPEEARTRLGRLRQAMATSLSAGIPNREWALKLSERLISSVDEPEALQEDVTFLKALVAQQGLQNLKALVSPFWDPHFDQASPEQKQPVIAKAIDSIYQALAVNPANTNRLMQRTAGYVNQQIPAGAMRSVALGALNGLRDNLNSPEVIQPILTLVQTGLSQNSLASLQTLIKPFTEPGFSRLPALQKQQRIETLLTTIYKALVATPQHATTWLNQLEEAVNLRLPIGTKRGSLNFVLTHLKRNLMNPVRMTQEIRFISQVLGNGGLEKLQTLLPVMNTPQFLQADSLHRGRAILEGMGPILKPLLSQPEETKAVLDNWLETLQQSYPPGLIRDTVSLLGNHLNQNLDHPERLIKALQLSLDIMESGGFKKLDTLESVIQSERYKAAAPMKQGQYLLEALGPIYVKALQTLSTIPDLFPPHIQESMKQLYEDITPIPFEEIRSVVETELGMPIAMAFDSFDPVPVKAGSVAQVHRAVVNGRQVAVKVVKPDVEFFMEEDMNLLKPLVMLGQEMAPHLDANAFYDAFKALVKNEANMSQMSPDAPEGEAQRLMKIKEIYRPMPNVIVPEVIQSHTSKHVLTMEFMNGKSLLNFTGKAQVAQNYLELLLDQIFYYGACQADPHPGNILYQADTKKFACIDAGLMYFSPPQERLTFAKTLVALYTQNISQIAYAVTAPGMDKSPNFGQFMAKLNSLSMLPQDKMDYKSTLLYLDSITRVAREFSIETVTINPLLWKTLFTALSVAQTLDPKVNIAYPAILKLATLFISEREAGFLSTTAWSLLRERGGQLWDYLGRQFKFGS